MSKDTYDQHLMRGGAPLSPARIDAFKAHRRTCAVCSGPVEYGYTTCPEGLRLAREMVKPLDNR
jgi:hypothetical protein